MDNLKELKILFSQLTSVADDVKALNDAIRLDEKYFHDKDATTESAPCGTVNCLPKPLRGSIRDLNLSPHQQTIGMDRAVMEIGSDDINGITKPNFISLKLNQFNADSLNMGILHDPKISSTFMSPVENAIHDITSQSNGWNGLGEAHDSNDHFFNVEKHTPINVQLPIDPYFSEGRLNSTLKKKSDQSITNYFYYLFDGSGVECGTENCLPVGTSDNVNSGSSFQLSGTENVLRNSNVNQSIINVANVYESDSDSIIDVCNYENMLQGMSYDPSDSVSQIGSDSIIDLDKDDNVGMSDANSDLNEITIKPQQGSDNSDMIVPTSDVKGKKLCCMYCHKRYQKLARHLMSAHKNEVEVKKFKRCPPRSTLRKEIIARIRKRGQFEWNTNATINKKELQLSRRPNKKFKRNPLDYLTCVNCFGTYAKTVLTRHWKKCTDNQMNDGRNVMALGRAAEGRLHENASDELRTDVFAKIRDDLRVRTIRFDWLVIAYGNELCLNYSPHYQHGYIRKKLRDAAKVLFAARCISADIQDFASLFHVRHCNIVVEAIRVVARFDRKTKYFGSPGTASTLVTLINTVGDLLVVESLKMDDAEKERDVERFLKVFQRDVKTKISKLVTVTQAKNRRNRKENIPTTEDVNKFALYLDVEREKCFEELSSKFDSRKWTQLSELTLVSILAFNRRRTGEMSNIVLEDYINREVLADQCEKEFDVLSDETKRLINSRMKIRGKLGRTVPVLLKHCFGYCIDILIHHRKAAGIPDKNQFMFAVPSKTGQIKTIDACAAIRSFSVACGAENPSSLRGTKLRKHMASFCGAKDLTETDIANLAKFMGHDTQVHRDVYRHNPLELEVEQMTRLLEEAQGRRKSTKLNHAKSSAAQIEALKKIMASDTSSGSSSDSEDERNDEDENEEPEKAKKQKRKVLRKRVGTPKTTKKTGGNKKTAKQESSKNRKTLAKKIPTSKTTINKENLKPKTAIIPKTRTQNRKTQKPLKRKP